MKTSTGILFKHHRFQILLFAFLLVILAFGNIFIEKGEGVRWVNSNHSNFLDYSLRIPNTYGDGLSYLFLAIILLFVRYRAAIIAATSWLIITLLVTLMKQVIFQNQIRPSVFFNDNIDLHIVEGIKLHSLNSFPSGHASTAMALTTLIWLFSQSVTLRIITLILALAAAYARMYYLRHFYMDVVAGMWIGFIFSMGIYFLLERRK